MKLNARLAACFVAGLVCCTLFSCGPGAQPQTAASAPAAPDPGPAPALTGTLSVYLEQDYIDNVFADYPVGQALRQFQRENPQLTLEFISPPNGGDPGGLREAAITRLETELLAGGGPDLFLFGARFSSVNLFPDLQKAMRNRAFLDCRALLAQRGADLGGDAFWPGVMACGQVDGAQYIVPLSFNLPVALAVPETLEKAGFDRGVAQSDIGSFYGELARVYAEMGIPSYNEVFQVTNMAQPMVDYSQRAVNFSTGLCRAMLELDKANLTAPWNQGRKDFTQEYNRQGPDNFFWREALRLAAGERLLYAGRFDLVVQTAWALSAQGAQAAFLQVPNENGGVTANVDSYAAVNANARNPEAATALIAFLLEAPRQSAAAWPATLPALAVRRESLAPSVESMRQFELSPWWFAPTPEQRQAYFERFGTPLEEQTGAEKEAYLLQHGEALPAAGAQALAALCEKIDAAHLQDLWDHAVDIGENPDGDSLMNSLMNEYMAGILPLDELIAQIEPRLQLYLDE